MTAFVLSKGLRLEKLFHLCRLPANQIAMIIDKGHDFPAPMYPRLLEYGSDMWIFREQPGSVTTRALNSYRGDYRK
jgi:hypothetical protein